MSLPLPPDVGETNGGDSVGSELLAEKSRRREFLVQLNEELRTPLNDIIDLAGHLEKQSAHTDITGDVARVRERANHLRDIMDRKLIEPVHIGDTSAAHSFAHSQCDVLHIEDDAINFASVKLLLGSQRKLKVLRAINGEQGINLAQTFAPRLILLDLDLPDIHGSEVFQRLQKEAVTGDIPVVVLSGDSSPSQIERLLILGARNYLIKPFKIPTFLAVIDGILQKNTPVESAKTERSGAESIAAVENQSH